MPFASSTRSAPEAGARTKPTEQRDVRGIHDPRPGGAYGVLDDGVVLAVVNQAGRPAGVDGQVHQQEGWAICWSADGLLVRLTTHIDIDEARAASERLAEWRG